MNDRIFIIAEAGVNHNGSLSTAKKMVKVAKECGADAIKFQSFSADEITCTDTMRAKYQARSNDTLESQYVMLKKLELSKSSFNELNNLCKEYQIEFMSTPFDINNAKYLIEELKMEKIKIASGEIINHELLYQLGKYKKPIILSTGMSDISEIEYALDVISCSMFNVDFKEGYFTKLSKEKRIEISKYIILMHCISEYPAPYNEINLNSIKYLKDKFKIKVGLSDHTMGTFIPVAAVALGAEVIEKHFTLNKDMKGPDHSSSLNPNELKEMVINIRETNRSFGIYDKKPSKSEMMNISSIRRSIVAKKEILKGEKFTNNNICLKRANGKYNPINLFDVLGKKSKNNYKKDQLIHE
ncbi:MAG TPA: N-acetylneuraminate synthase [Gammaproteobacteria bacterium]|nr:N-acetylneuraminate synthase [Gammaproteobacteria bacterium]|tara:strand:+ start:3040 stop:4107 length:1068 start_codon:yes stop_codon:yes gene_type:complete